MKKKIVAMCATVALAAVAVGSTLAYFTDVDQNTNEFGVAGLEIDLYEDVNFVDGAGKAKALLVGSNTIFADADDHVFVGKDSDSNPGVKYNNIMPGDRMGKVVTVENKENYAAYVALAIQNPDYNYKINPNIDGYYEKLSFDELKALGSKFTGNVVEDMQTITDDIWSGTGWELSYDKLSNPFGIRYYPTHSTPVDQDGSESYVGKDGVQLIAIDYTVWQLDGTNVGYANNMMGPDGYQGAEDKARMWVYYLYLPAKASYTLDLSVTCPTYITTDNIEAFKDMQIDVQAAAIQVDGFASAKDAFEELNKTHGFDF